MAVLNVFLSPPLSIAQFHTLPLFAATSSRSNCRLRQFGERSQDLRVMPVNFDLLPDARNPAGGIN